MVSRTIIGGLVLGAFGLGAAMLGWIFGSDTSRR